MDMAGRVLITLFGRVMGVSGRWMMLLIVVIGTRIRILI